MLELSVAGKLAQSRVGQSRGLRRRGLRLMAVIEQSFIETSKSGDLVVGWEEGVLMVQFQERRALEMLG